MYYFNSFIIFYWRFVLVSVWGKSHAPIERTTVTVRRSKRPRLEPKGCGRWALEWSVCWMLIGDTCYHMFKKPCHLLFIEAGRTTEGVVLFWFPESLNT